MASASSHGAGRALITTCVAAGRHEQALDGLEALLRVDPTFALLHANPRFRRLVGGVQHAFDRLAPTR
jgi:hypothetical protein